MHLPTPQFSRLVTVLAFDVTSPSLDSMFIAWDHISTRYLNRIEDRAAASKVESIRWLAIHDAVLSVLGPGAGFLFTESSTGTSLSAALAAAAQASHDILASAFNSPADLADLDHTLEESLSLISDTLEKAVGSATGAASAGTFIKAFGNLSSIFAYNRFPASVVRPTPAILAKQAREYHEIALSRFELQRSA